MDEEREIGGKMKLQKNYGPKWGCIMGIWKTRVFMKHYSFLYLSPFITSLNYHIYHLF